MYVLYYRKYNDKKNRLGAWDVYTLQALSLIVIVAIGSYGGELVVVIFVHIELLVDLTRHVVIVVMINEVVMALIMLRWCTVVVVVHSS